MLSTGKTICEGIHLNGNYFDKSSADDKDMIESYLRDHCNFIVPVSLNLRNSNLSDDLFLPIVNVLKFVKTIDLDSNDLTFKSLYAIFEVLMF